MTNVTDTVRKLTEAINAGKLEDAIARAERSRQVGRHPEAEPPLTVAALYDLCRDQVLAKNIPISHRGSTFT